MKLYGFTTIVNHHCRLVATNPHPTTPIPLDSPFKPINDDGYD
jgi:hypothetical protein